MMWNWSCPQNESILEQNIVRAVRRSIQKGFSLNAGTNSRVGPALNKILVQKKRNWNEADQDIL